MKRVAGSILSFALLTLLLAGQARADRFMNACLAASGSNVFAVWYEHTADSDAICFRTSPDGGATWKPIKQIMAGVIVDSPALAVLAPYVYVAARVYDGSKFEIRLLRSTNRGSSWEAPVSLSGPGDFLNRPSVSAALNRVDVFWQEGTSTGSLIGHNGSKNYGQTWKGRDYYIGSDGNRSDASTAAEGPTSCLSWSEYDPLSDQHGWGFFRWTNHSEELFINFIDATRYDQSADCGKDIAGMIWIEEVGGGAQVKVSRLADFASGWSAGTPLNVLTSYPSNPSLKHSGATVYATWTGFSEADFSEFVFLARSTDTGLTWKPEKKISPVGERIESAALAASGSNVYVSWWVMTKTLDGPRTDLFLRRSTDRGITWKAPQKIASWTSTK